MPEDAGKEIEGFRREIAERVRAHPEDCECRLNPAETIVDALIEGLVRRKAKFGDYYCPCRIVTGNAETDRHNVCPCTTHQAEIAENGKCHCGMYVGENDY
jgi:ferredoxin-thioredoxin reductase catalytic subunit